MSALTKAQLVETLMNQLQLAKQDAKQFVDEFFEQLCEALEAGHHVRLSGFGNFILRDKSARPGRNPKTGEAVSVTARRVVTFKIGSKFKSRLE